MKDCIEQTHRNSHSTGQTGPIGKDNAGLIISRIPLKNQSASKPGSASQAFLISELMIT